MGRRSLQFTLALFFVLTANLLVAQRTVTGLIKDAGNKEALIGASVLVKGTTNGTVTNVDGSFSLEIPNGKQTLVVSFIGYLAQEINVAGGTNSIETVLLESDAVGLGEVSVIASVAVDRKTPVAVSKIDPVIISEKLGTQEFPEILKSTPSVYATKQGGGFGDSRINLRGFNSQNVAVMINGVPVNDMESGKVYWSNWAGLGDVTRSMQVQRGLGASKVAVPSIGGTINILTKTTDTKRGGNVYHGVGNNGYQKTGVTLSTGLTDKGWAFTTALSQVEGDGWVDGTQFKGYSYFMNVSKRVNDAHTLSFSVFGAPQEHGQRYEKRKIADYSNASRGLQHNADWGYRDGQVLNLRRNTYHKPQAILNHFWTLSEKTSLSTAIYASLGTGGGTGGTGETTKFKYLKNEQIDFDRIVAENEARLNAGSDVIIRTGHNNHQWYGILSSLSHELTDELKLTAGLDYRYYVGEHYQTVSDLLGGEFYLDTKNRNNPNNAAKVGDKIGYHNDGIVSWSGLFTQLEYSTGPLSAFAAGSFSYMMMTRKDYFNNLESEGQTSDAYSFPAYSIKGGANYNLNDYHNVFANLGYFERQPTFRTLFPKYNNDANEDAVNEKIMSFELGYGFRQSQFTANVNLYRTTWMDRAYTISRPDQDGNIIRANIEGVDALHQGIEVDMVYKPVTWLSINAMASVGDWTWLNNVEDVRLVDENNVQVGDPINVFVKDVHVGDAAQTTAALGVNIDLMKGLRIGADYNYFANLYAEFDPIDRSTATDANNLPDSWKMPDYHLFDLNARYKFDFGPFNAIFSAKVNNVFDVEYLTDGDDGETHNWDSAEVFYGVGRTWSASFKVKF